MNEDEWARKLGRHKWWNTEVDAQGIVRDKSWNIENVLSCFCGDHPIPKYPPLTYSINDEDITTLLAGVPRSGNTVTWQILNYLLDGKIARTHGFYDSCPVLYDFKKIIVTVRNPYDVAYSLKRVGWYSREKNQEIWDDIARFVSLSRFQNSISYRPDLKIVYLKYEEVWDKPDERINYLANILEKELTEDQLKNILRDTSIEKNVERSIKQSKISSKAGKRVQDENKINPNHVGPEKGAPGQGSELDIFTKQDILDSCAWAFETFGYEK